MQHLGSRMDGPSILKLWTDPQLMQVYTSLEKQIYSTIFTIKLLKG